MADYYRFNPVNGDAACETLEVDTVHSNTQGAPNFDQGLTLSASKDITLGSSGKVLADTIADRAGTGAPAFSMGLSVATGKRAIVTGMLTVGAATSLAIASSVLAEPTVTNCKVADATANIDLITSATATDGQILVIRNPAGSNTVTCRDSQAASGNNKALRLGGATRALVGDSSITLMYDLTNAYWQELAFSANT